MSFQPWAQKSLAIAPLYKLYMHSWLAVTQVLGPDVPHPKAILKRPKVHWHKCRCLWRVGVALYDRVSRVRSKMNKDNSVIWEESTAGKGWSERARTSPAGHAIKQQAQDRGRRTSPSFSWGWFAQKNFTSRYWSHQSLMSTLKQSPVLLWWWHSSGADIEGSGKTSQPVRLKKMSLAQVWLPSNAASSSKALCWPIKYMHPTFLATEFQFNHVYHVIIASKNVFLMPWVSGVVTLCMSCLQNMNE